mgnify:CR=1 FL=1
MNANSYASPGTPGGNREWLGTEATIIEPEKTPLFSTIKKNNNAKGTFYEAVADRLDIPSIAGTRTAPPRRAGAWRRLAAALR